MTGSTVEISKLSKRFQLGDQTINVFDDLEITLGAGESAVVTGRSGSGKSTLLHILGLLEAPTSGNVMIDSIVATALNDAEQADFRRSKIGFVFQAHHLLPEHTALDNVALPVRLAGYAPKIANERAEALLECVGLAERLRHQPGELSGGEQQRVALARALVMGPSLVLADEPTGNLDPETALGIIDLILRLNQEMGTTLVVVTHSMALANMFPRKLVLGDTGLCEVAE